VGRRGGSSQSFGDGCGLNVVREHLGADPGPIRYRHVAPVRWVLTDGFRSYRPPDNDGRTATERASKAPTPRMAARTLPRSTAYSET